jgi:hypothetical protein
MRVKVLSRDVGKVGSVREIDAASARVLILLNKAEAVAPEPKPAPVVRKKRTYRRKDIQAAPVQVVEVAEYPHESTE